MADRFTYVPLVGVFVALAWLAARRGRPRLVAAAAVRRAGAARGADAGADRASGATRRRSSRTRSRSTSANPIAHVNLGVALGERGDLDGANAHLERALELRPDTVTARVALGNTSCGRGRVDEALAHYRAAVAADPRRHALTNLGFALLQRAARRGDRGLERALRVEPELRDGAQQPRHGLRPARRARRGARALRARRRRRPALRRRAQQPRPPPALGGALDEALAHAERPSPCSPRSPRRTPTASSRSSASGATPTPGRRSGTPAPPAWRLPAGS